ncbi:hypothetical protein D3877_03220 [Azospirillum cavernae]|uniref:Uncharacterized protein n=1 Tax=Azospirillum cavernae TaxID=2320860 RepID=A0A418W0W2_9PROT|nr:hypothetical protein [Azospirillum cavernae]RJF83672.1 hypothetical protein D3877_03220 [Azospirillum cavernae]
MFLIFLALACLVAINAWTIWIAATRRGVVQAYWALSGSFMGIGLMAVIGVFAFPGLLQLDPTSGEMPPAFGLGFGLVVIGLTGVAIGAAMMGLARLWRRKRAASALAAATADGADAPSGGTPLGTPIGTARDA